MRDAKGYKKLWTGMVTRYLPTDDLPTRRFREDLDFMILGGGIGAPDSGPREPTLASALRDYHSVLRGTTGFSRKRDYTAESNQILRGYNL